MGLIGDGFRRLQYLVNRRRADELLRQEIEAHRAMMAEPRRFGNTLQLREQAQDMWGWRWLDDIIRDTRLAIRGLYRARAFTLTAISSLALGLALTASTAAVVNAYLLRSLPYPAADRLYHVMYAPPGPWEPRGMSALDWQSVNDVVEFPLTAVSETFYLTDAGGTRTARGQRVSRGFIEGLGVRAVIGRSLCDDGCGDASEQVALIGHGLWREQYGSDPQIVGRYVRAESENREATPEAFRVVGVLPPDFYFGRDSREKVDLLVPLRAPARTYMVRLREGVPPSLAEARITGAARRVSSNIPSDWSGVRLESVHDRYVTQMRPALIGVTVASALVLVIVCANVAILTLLRTMRRQKEIAVRAALGSGRRHLLRMLAVETSLLCAASVALALWLTRLTLRLIAPMIETQLGRAAPAGTSAIAVDTTVLLVVAGIGVLVALSLAFLPLLLPWQRRLADALRRDDRTSSESPAMRRVRSGLIGFEVAVTLVLLAGCGLMLRSVVTMLQTDLGVHTEHLVRSRVVLRAANYPDAPAFARFYDQFTERVRARTNASLVLASWPPFAEHPVQDIEADGRVGARTSAGTLAVGARYFNTLGIPLRRGRDFAAADRAGSEPVAIVSETLARHLWPNEEAVGRQIRGIEQTPRGLQAGAWRTVVGVAADVRQTYADGEVKDLYVPVFQAGLGRFGAFYLRTEQPPPAVHAMLRSALSELDATAVIGQPRSVDSQNHQLASTAFLTSMLSGFTAIAVFLAVLGIYGVTAYAAQQRRREIAIRTALGATRSIVTRLFLRDGGRVLGAGIAAGVVGTFAGARLIRSQVGALPPLDVLTVAATCALLLAAGALATWLPARRAAIRAPLAELKEG